MGGYKQPANHWAVTTLHFFAVRLVYVGLSSWGRGLGHRSAEAGMTVIQNLKIHLSCGPHPPSYELVFQLVYKPHQYYKVVSYKYHTP